VLHGYSGDRFGGLPSAINSSIYASGHQLRSGIALGHYDFVLQPQGLFDSPPPLIQLPAPLYLGPNSVRGASTHFGKVTQPDGVMLQLGQRSSSYDLWLWVPAGTDHNQSSPLALSPGPQPVEGVQRAALHHRPAACGSAVGDGHGGLHPQLPAHERGWRPPASPAGTAS
jgi:hypothetical protein